MTRIIHHLDVQGSIILSRPDIKTMHNRIIQSYKIIRTMLHSLINPPNDADEAIGNPPNMIISKLPGDETMENLPMAEVHGLQEGHPNAEDGLQLDGAHAPEAIGDSIVETPPEAVKEVSSKELFEFLSERVQEIIHEGNDDTHTYFVALQEIYESKGVYKFSVHSEVEARALQFIYLDKLGQEVNWHDVFNQKREQVEINEPDAVNTNAEETEEIFFNETEVSNDPIGHEETSSETIPTMNADNNETNESSEPHSESDEQAPGLPINETEVEVHLFDGEIGEIFSDESQLSEIQPYFQLIKRNSYHFENELGLSMRLSVKNPFKSVIFGGVAVRDISLVDEQGLPINDSKAILLHQNNVVLDEILPEDAQYILLEMILLNEAPTVSGIRFNYSIAYLTLLEASGEQVLALPN